MLPEPTTVVTLPDGRTIAADDVGEPSGVPVVYLHGAPDCRLARHPDDGVAAAAGVRLVAVDRPGYGWTDPQPGAPDVRAWADDVAALLDHLGIERCRIVAWSAGASWSIGVAAAAHERVDRLVTYAALAPLEAFGDEAVAAASGPRTGIAADVIAGADVVLVATEFADVLVPVSPIDLDTARDLVLESYGERARAEVGSVDGALDAMARSLAAAIERHGGAGLRADVVAQFSPGITDAVGGLQCETVFVHGTEDRIAGPAVGRWLADRVDGAALEVWPDAGHHALFPRWADLLALAVSGVR